MINLHVMNRVNLHKICTFMYFKYEFITKNDSSARLAQFRPCGGDDFILRSKYEKTLDWKCIAKVRLSSESEKYIYVCMYLLKEEKCKSNNESSHLIIAWSSNSVSLCMESSLWNNRLRHLTSKRVMKKRQSANCTQWTWN